MVGEVGIFQLERIIKRVQAPKCQEFLTVKSTGPTPAPEDGHIPLALVGDGNWIMRSLQKTHLPSDPGLTGLFATPGLVLEENLARHCKDILLLEPVQQRLEKIRVHLHIIVQKNDNIVLGGLDTGVIATGKSPIGWQRHNSYRREMSTQEVDTAVATTVIYDDDLMLPALLVDSFDYRREKLLEQMLTIPVENDNTGTAIVRPVCCRDSLG